MAGDWVHSLSLGLDIDPDGEVKVDCHGKLLIHAVGASGSEN